MAEAGPQMTGGYSLAFMLVGSALAVLSLHLSAIIVRAPGASLLRSMLATGVLGILTVALAAALARVEPAWQIISVVGVALAAVGLIRSIFRATLLQSIGILVLCIMLQAIVASLYVQAAEGEKGEPVEQAEPGAAGSFAVDGVMCYNHRATSGFDRPGWCLMWRECRAYGYSEISAESSPMGGGLGRET